MKQVANISEYQAIVEKYGQKGCLSNDYIQQQVADLIEHGALFVDRYVKNVFLYVRKNVGMRVYYYLNDLTERSDFSSYKDLVVEILFRGELPQTEINYLVECGFTINLIRDQYAAMYKNIVVNVDPKSGVKIEVAQTLSTIEQACTLFNESFDKLSGDFIPENEYRNLLDAGSVIVAWNSDQSILLGALHQIKEGTVNVIGHVAVNEYARGCGVGKALLKAFVDRNSISEKTRYQLWVQRQNEVAVAMYKGSGFRYLNKSTISLIK